ncbi:hypothetical protein LTR66_016925, partial [Elasticomyces elasticus]
MSATLTVAAPAMDPRDISNEGHDQIEHFKRGTALFGSDVREADVNKRGTALFGSNVREADVNKRGISAFRSDAREADNDKR